MIWGPTEALATKVTTSHPYPVGEADCSKVSGQKDLQPRNPLKGKLGALHQALSPKSLTLGDRHTGCPDLKRTAVQEHWSQLGRQASPLSGGKRVQMGPYIPGSMAVSMMLLSKVGCPSQSRGCRAKTNSMESRDSPTRSPSAEDTLGVGPERALEVEIGFCSLPPPPPAQAIHASIQAHLEWKCVEGARPGAGSLPSPLYTYLQKAVLRVLADIWLVLQDWRPPTVKGLYGTIYGGRGPGWARLGNPSTRPRSSGTNRSSGFLQWVGKIGYLQGLASGMEGA